MKLDAATLRQLSPLLDEALDLDESEREAWLASLSGEAAKLVPTLRELLAKQASVETNDLLERGPQFTAPGADARASEFKEGDAVGPYRLMRELGHGGMGEVWLAERSDGVLKRSVALKLPMLSLRRSVLVQRFERERDILGALAHPNIARLYVAGLAADGQPFLALEYVEGLPIGAATDVYALGVPLYELLTHAQSFNGTRREVEQAILTKEPAAPRAPPADLSTIVLKALKKSPAERYSTVSAYA